MAFWLQLGSLSLWLLSGVHLLQIEGKGAATVGTTFQPCCNPILNGRREGQWPKELLSNRPFPCLWMWLKEAHRNQLPP